eukprot:scaffold4675_cov101-Cylindrotheca_fusiformis.AAC.6
MAIKALQRSRQDRNSRSRERKPSSNNDSFALRRRRASLSSHSKTEDRSQEDEFPNLEESSFAESSVATTTVEWNPFDNEDNDSNERWAVVSPSDAVNSSPSCNTPQQNPSSLRKAFRISPLVRARKMPELDRSAHSEGHPLAAAISKKRGGDMALRRHASARSLMRKERNALLPPKSPAIRPIKSSGSFSSLRHSSHSKNSSSCMSNASFTNGNNPKQGCGALSSFLEQGSSGRRERAFQMGPKEPKGKGYISSFLGSSHYDDDDNNGHQEKDDTTHISFLSKGITALEKIYDDINNT